MPANTESTSRIDEQTARRRVVIEGVTPEVAEGRYPAKRALNERVVVEADIFADNHETLAADLLFRCKDDPGWTAIPMEPLVNDRWHASFTCDRMTPYVYTIEAWVDPFARWRDGLAKKAEAGQDVTVDLLVGARLIEEAVARAGKEADALRNTAAKLSARTAVARRVEVALDEGLALRMRDLADRRYATRYHRELAIKVDPPDAVYSTWYEMFPRSASPDSARPGTFRDVEDRLGYVAGMGFDVLYLPPIHPIGTTHRKGPNNRTEAAPGDPGSPWAIGSAEGGHKSIDPALGTLDDFRRLVRKARDRRVEIALDIAFQCSPDHPWVKDHPQWFKTRPDGTVQYAENPPKKYEDIFPLNFETDDWRALWEEAKSVFLYWMEQGVRVFRVDNPHTKPFPFWEWLIAEVHAVDPGVIMLSESFTRPKIMYYLAELGFTQSYTYFAWRFDKWGLTEYFSELTRPPVVDFFRPNAWPNTPDILTEQLQHGGRPAFVARLVLAATLSSNYGIYGPAYELMEHVAREPGSEEYLNSEKYEVKHWDLDRGDSLRDLIALVNKARRDNPALQSNWGLRFHDVDNAQLIAYSKATDDARNIVITVVNLDPNQTHGGWLTLPIADWGILTDEPYQVHDLLGDARYTWHGARNFVQLNPQVVPAHVMRLRRRTTPPQAPTAEFE
jgi:starch synthase (maltosyl-transferring)